MSKSKESTTTTTSEPKLPFVQGNSGKSWASDPEKMWPLLGVFDIPELAISAEFYVQDGISYQGVVETRLHVNLPRAYTMQLIQASAMKRATQLAQLMALPGDPITKDMIRPHYQRIMSEYQSVWTCPEGAPKPAITKDRTEGLSIIIDGQIFDLREGFSSFTPTFIGRARSDEEYQAKREYRRAHRTAVTMPVVNLAAVTENLSDF